MPSTSAVPPCKQMGKLRKFTKAKGSMVLLSPIGASPVAFRRIYNYDLISLNAKYLNDFAALRYSVNILNSNPIVLHNVLVVAVEWEVLALAGCAPALDLFGGRSQRMFRAAESADKKTSRGLDYGDLANGLL
ncbi:unnamed protein product [Leptidea sinapis]|uniref:Uncharacterized protein n=1 Tax=Leptidea sinapis TaxID=189913 RepID=A0A5E4QFW2_9NEOP|nr:unnamed protein product [Leptidea sinapis]